MWDTHGVRHTKETNPSRAAAMPAFGVPHNIPLRRAVVLSGFDISRGAAYLL